MGKIVVVFGTRPEFIKVLPVYLEAKRRDLQNSFCFINTNQQSNFVLKELEIQDFKPNYNIPFHANNHSIVETFGIISKELESIILNIQSDEEIKWIVAQGDTISTFATAFVAFMNQIPLAHIEAGLRTHDMSNPFPEEFCRQSISQIAKLHFAPTQIARENLLAQGISEQDIVLSGNTVIDSLKIFEKQPIISNRPKINEKKILITCHRRENQNGVLNTLIHSIEMLSEQYKDFKFIWLRHSNPELNSKLEELNSTENLFIMDPLSYSDMLVLYESLNVIITDSGGIQEEASHFGIPVIVIREKTERPESISAGISVLSSPNHEDLKTHFEALIKKNRTPIPDLYGNGNAAKTIVDYLIS